MGRQQSYRKGDGRLDLQAEFLAIVVWSHQTVDLGDRCDLIFFVEDAAPVELRLNAIVVLDVEVVGRNELPHSGSKDGANGREDRPLGVALIAEGDDHRAFGGEMTLVNHAGDMLLRAEEAEIRGGAGPQCGVPFVGPSHGHSDRVFGLDLHVHAAAADCGIVDAASAEAGRLQSYRFAVGRGPVSTVLSESKRGEGAENRGDDGGVSHNN